MSVQADNAYQAAQKLFAGLLRGGFQLTRLYPYEREDGTPIYYRARFTHDVEGKAIRALHKTEDGWVAREPKLSTNLLYGLPKLARQRQHDPLVVIVEGEKAADAVNTWTNRTGARVVAVTSGGSTSASGADWTPLRGLSCLVWPDNDLSGAKYADAVTAALRGVATNIERVDIEPLGLPEKGDADDWLESHPDAGADAMATLPRVLSLPIEVGDGWPDPVALPDPLPPAPAWDWNLLPPELSPRVRCTASRLSIPPEAAAAPLLAALGGVVGRSCQVEIRPGWVVVPNMWSMVVAPPSMLKSPAQSEATFALSELEVGAQAQHQEARKRAELDDVVRALKAKKRKKDAGKALDKSDDETARELLRMDVDEDLALPPQRRFCLHTFTVEKLGEILRDNPRGVTICLDELMSLFRQCERAGHEQDRAFLLTSADGDKPVSWDTLSRGTISVTAACVSVLGSIQPNPLRELLRELEGSGGDGLLQRFGLMVRLDKPKVYAPTREAVDEDARQTVRSIFCRLSELGPVDSGGGPAMYRLSPGAQSLFDGYEDRLRNGLLSAGDDQATLVAHLGKQPKTVAALALLFRLCRVEDVGVEVGAEDMAMALRWAEFLALHAKRVYWSARTRQVEAADALLRRMKAGELSRIIQAREVYRNGWSLLSDPADAKAALELLEEFGWVRSTPRPTNGRMAKDWELHPVLPSVVAAAA